MENNLTINIGSKLAKRDEKEQKKKSRAKEPKKKVIKLSKKQLEIRELAKNTILPDNWEVVWEESQLRSMVTLFKDKEVIAVDTETYGIEPFKHDIVGFSIYAKDRGYYVPIHHLDDINQSDKAREEYLQKKSLGLQLKKGRDYVECLGRELISSVVRPLLEDASKKYIGHNCKFDSHILYNWLNITIKWFYDTSIGQSLLDENQSKRLKDIATIYLKVKADTFGKLFGNSVTFDTVPILMEDDRSGSLAAYYAIKDTYLTYEMYLYQIKHLKSEKLKAIYNLMFDIEMPFMEITTKAERRGVNLNSSYLEDEVAPVLHKELEELEERISKYAGDINVNSPKQLSEMMYRVLKIPHLNTKAPDSTDAKTLAKIIAVSREVVANTEPLVMHVVNNSKAKHFGVTGAIHDYIYSNKLGNMPRKELIDDVRKQFEMSLDLCSALRDYRGKSKLTSSFADKLPKSVVNGKVHTSFNTCGTKTGRLSSSEPNLQQIPARVGGLIRNAFYASEGRLLASIDFSQQELRVLTHITEDPVLMDIYLNGGDVHSMTALGMWNRKHPEDKVTYEQFQMGRELSDLFRDADGNIVDEWFSDAHIGSLKSDGKLPKDSPTQAIEVRKWVELGSKFEKMRKSAKVVNFGIVYGMSEIGLSDTLEITEEEAAIYIQGYFDAYPGVQKAMKDTEKVILKQKYTSTLLGRKRRLYPEVDSGKRWLIESAFRMGFNAIIQGSSADMCKKAAIDMQPLLKELDAHIVLYVHDEILFDVPENIGMDNLKKIADIMCNAIPLKCGLKSDIEVGRKWGQKMSEDEINALMNKGA